MADRTALDKRSIEPVTVTIEVTATQVNSKGTLCGYTNAKLIKAPKLENNGFLVSAPTVAGGGIYVKFESDNGLKYLTTTEAKAARPKFF